MIHACNIHISENVEYNVKILVPIEILPMNFRMPVIWIRDGRVLNDECKVTVVDGNFNTLIIQEQEVDIAITIRIVEGVASRVYGSTAESIEFLVVRAICVLINFDKTLRVISRIGI